MTEMYGDTYEFLDEGAAGLSTATYQGEDVLIIEFEPSTTVLETQAPEFIDLTEIGPGGGSGGVTTFTHIQSSPASTWIITHNLGRPKEPVVILDNQPTLPVWTDVEHGSINQTTLTFPEPVTGKAYF